MRERVRESYLYFVRLKKEEAACVVVKRKIHLLQLRMHVKRNEYEARRVVRGAVKVVGLREAKGFVDGLARG